MTTALITHHDCYDHVTPPGHPECVDRIRAVERALVGDGFMMLTRVAAPAATDAALLRAHPRSHLDMLEEAAPAEGWTSLDPDTFLCPGSLRAARRAAGANVLAVDMVMSGEVRNAFCAVRPPGHHAETARAMGFCLFNNAAVGALHAIEAHGLRRVAIVDFDVHHGNGCQEIFQRDGRVMYGSTHEWPNYPGTGRAEETGAGNIVNAPLPPHTAGADFRAAYEHVILPALDAFRPELTIIAAGFDAHVRDPLASFELVEADYVWVTDRLCDVADVHGGGRVVSTLEGGYDLTGLGRSVAAHVTALMERG